MYYMSNKGRCSLFKTTSRPSQLPTPSLSKISNLRLTRRISLRKRQAKLLTLSTTSTTFVPNRTRELSHLVKTIGSKRTLKTSCKSSIRSQRKPIRLLTSSIKFMRSSEMSMTERRLTLRTQSLSKCKWEDLELWTIKNEYFFRKKLY